MGQARSTAGWMRAAEPWKTCGAHGVGTGSKEGRDGESSGRRCEGACVRHEVRGRLNDGERVKRQMRPRGRVAGPAAEPHQRRLPQGPAPAGFRGRRPSERESGRFPSREASPGGGGSGGGGTGCGAVPGTGSGKRQQQQRRRPPPGKVAGSGAAAEGRVGAGSGMGRPRKGGESIHLPVRLCGAGRGAGGGRCRCPHHALPPPGPRCWGGGVAACGSRAGPVPGRAVRPRAPGLPAAGPARRVPLPCPALSALIPVPGRRWKAGGGLPPAGRGSACPP